MAAERTSVGPMAAPRRNIELKASDPDPERSLAVVLGLGARDRGVLRQRDTYFRVDHGPPEAARGRARRRHAGPVRPRRRRRGAREPLPADPGRRPGDADAPRWSPASARSRWSRRSATCCCGRTCASTSTASRTSATSSSSRASRPRTPTSPTSSNASPGSPRRWRSRPSASCATPTRDQVVGSSALVDAARAVMERAHAPYSQLPRRRGAARRGRLDPRRRQRRERRLPAGPVRGGVARSAR